MKVSELIEGLKNLDPCLDVRIDCPRKCRFFMIDGYLTANIYNESSNKMVSFVELLINTTTKVIRYERERED